MSKSRKQASKQKKASSTEEPQISPETPPVDPKEMQQLMNSKLAQLQIARGMDDSACKYFLDECKQNRATFSLSQETSNSLKQDFLNSIQSITDENEKREMIRKIFKEMNLSRNKTKKATASNLSRLKDVSNESAIILAEKLQLENELPPLENANLELEGNVRTLQQKLLSIKETIARSTAAEATAADEQSQNFESSIQEVLKKLDDDDLELDAKQIENDTFRTKLDSARKHLSMREDHMNHLVKTKNLEKQIFEAKCAQRDQSLSKQFTELHTERINIHKLKMTCKELVDQIHLYKQKGHEFNSTISTSEALFEKFFEQERLMESVLARHLLESEKLSQKISDSERRIVESVTKMQENEQSLTKLRQRLQKKEKRCRVLQAERTTFRKVIKEEAALAAEEEAQQQSSMMENQERDDDDDEDELEEQEGNPSKS